MNRQKWTVPSLQKRPIYEALKAVSGVISSQKSEQYCDWRLDLSQGPNKVVAKQFSNGTLYLEGKPSGLWESLERAVNSVVGSNGKQPQSKTVATSSSSSLKNQGPDFLNDIYVGQDESGKGDYFGGIVVAGVCLNAQTSKALQSIGVQDSKALSAAEIQKLAKSIEETLPASSYHVISLKPEEYNETYEGFVSDGFSLNQMLGSLHAKVFEALYEANAGIKGVIVDQFGKPQDVTRYISPITLRQVKPVFETKAEKYTAVAAASILARAAFVAQMKEQEAHWQMRFPLGATHVIDAAKQFVRQKGKSCLKQVAKVHFKTTQTVLE